MEVYRPALNLLTTEEAIKFVKDTFEAKLAKALHLQRISAPLFVPVTSGLNDDLNGVERAVRFDIKGIQNEVAIVQSLAKWKRHALGKYHYPSQSGIYTDMNAIRRDEDLDELHSVYVDQWDWEYIIEKDQRNIKFLQDFVVRIYHTIKETQRLSVRKYPALIDYLPNEIHFITSEELLKMYPTLDAKERENQITKIYGAVCIEKIGYPLSDGMRHDGRSADYDDWDLNCDILVYYPPLHRAIELSSMGIRVDEESLLKQLTISNNLERLQLPFHQAVLHKQLPLTIGGGIGQSRLCLILLNKIHIGEVQCSTWNELPDEVKDYIL